MYSFPRILIFLAFGIALVQSYARISDPVKLTAFYEQNFQFPIIQIFHNDYFVNSPPFEDIQSIFLEAEVKNKDFSRFLMFNCQRVTKGDVYPCDDMNEKKESRKIVSYYPQSRFMNYGGKKMQDKSGSQQYSHESDTFKVAEFERTIEDVLPNFFEEMTNLQEFAEWLQVRYVPKLIFLTREEEIPLVIKQLGVHFFLRFDLAFVSDLTESITKQMNITTFPRLIVVQYNYEEYILDIFHYKDSDFSIENYQKIKTFLQGFALNEPRNDYLFSKIKAPADQGIVTVYNKTQLLKELDRSLGWVIVSQGREALKLEAAQQKYGRYFQYVHFEIDNETQILGLYDHDKQKSYEMPNDQVAFKALSRVEYGEASSTWLAKDYVVISVREQYSHLCALESYPLFKGLTRCLILKEQDYEQASNLMNIKFDYGFVSFENNSNKTEKISGRTFKNATFEEVYDAVSTLTRMKSAQVVEDFKKKPIKQIQGASTLSNLCSPSKKCALLFTHGNKKDRTAVEYLEEIAINFINEYEFYEIDLSCNSQFVAEIPSLKANYGGLVVYHSKKGSYVSLKAKLSKSTFEKFLRANLRDNKKLPFHEFKDSDIKVSSCNQKQKATSERTESDSL